MSSSFFVYENLFNTSLINITNNDDEKQFENDYKYILSNKKDLVIIKNKEDSFKIFNKIYDINEISKYTSSKLDKKEMEKTKLKYLLEKF